MGLFVNPKSANAAATTTTTTATETTPSAVVTETAQTETQEATTPNSSLTTPNSQEPAAPQRKGSREYVAPASPDEARQRIEESIMKGRIRKSDPVATAAGDVYEFSGRTFGHQQAFRMLGGTFDKAAQLWQVAVAYYDHPECCQTFFQAEADKDAAARDRRAQAEQKRAEADEAAIQQRINDAVAAALKGATPEGMITIEAARAATRRALQLMMNKVAERAAFIDEIINEAYVA